MKRLLPVLCAILLTLSMTACLTAPPADDTPDASSTPAQADDSVQSPISGTITISCYDTMTYKSFLEDAARAFEAENPGVTVTVTTFSAMPEIKTSESEGRVMTMLTMEDDTQARQDYISKISTEFMSGSGADILAIDILPYYKYADNGQLEDLNAFMDADADFTRSDYRENILDAIQYKGGQYVLPLDYMFTYLAYDSSLFPETQAALLTGGGLSYERLTDIGASVWQAANANAGQPVPMFGLTEEILVHQLIAENYNQFIDIEAKTVSAEDGGFARLLETVRDYAEQGYLLTTPGETGLQEQAMSLQRYDGQRFLYKTKTNFSLLQQINRDGPRIMMTTAGMGAGHEEDDKIAGMPAGQNGEIPFTYNQAYGMSAHSQNKQTAWAFLKFLLSEEQQTSLQLSLNGLPIHNAARARKCEMSVTGELFAQQANRNFVGQARSTPEGTPPEGGAPTLREGTQPGASQDQPLSFALTAEQAETLREYTEILEALSDQINTYHATDATIDAIVRGELNAYFNGTKTAAEAAAVVQNKISLYLGE